MVNFVDLQATTPNVTRRRISCSRFLYNRGPTLNIKYPLDWDSQESFRLPVVLVSFVLHGAARAQGLIPPGSRRTKRPTPHQGTLLTSTLCVCLFVRPSPPWGDIRQRFFHEGKRFDWGPQLVVAPPQQMNLSITTDASAWHANTCSEYVKRMQIVKQSCF